MDSRTLLAAVRQRTGITSNGLLALHLGVPEKSVQRWNTLRHAPDDEMAARLAGLAGLDPDAVVAAMHAQRAQDAASRERWSRIASRLSAGAVAAVAAAAVLGPWDGPPDAGAGAAVQLTVYTLCAMSALRLALQAAGRRPWWLRPAALQITG
jgi:plasmid maintenance system antidote protein VapI